VRLSASQAGKGWLAPQQVEHREPVGVGDDGLAVDQAGVHRQVGDRRYGKRETIREVIAPAGVQGDTLGVALGLDTEAVVLNFVNPPTADRRRLGRPW
jgi:hypothetical protein